MANQYNLSRTAMERAVQEAMQRSGGGSSVGAFQRAVRADDYKLMVAYAADLLKDGLSDRDIFRIGLGADPDLSTIFFNPMMLEAHKLAKV